MEKYAGRQEPLRQSHRVDNTRKAGSDVSRWIANILGSPTSRQILAEMLVAAAGAAAAVLAASRNERNETKPQAMGEAMKVAAKSAAVAAGGVLTEATATAAQAMLDQSPRSKGTTLRKRVE